MIDATQDLESLDFAMFDAPEASPGRLAKASETTFRIYVGGRCIGKAHSEDAAKARAEAVNGSYAEVA